jgi:hypothetical protein
VNTSVPDIARAKVPLPVTIKDITKVSMVPVNLQVIALTKDLAFVTFIVQLLTR